MINLTFQTKKSKGFAPIIILISAGFLLISSIIASVIIKKPYLKNSPSQKKLSEEVATSPAIPQTQDKVPSKLEQTETPTRPIAPIPTTGTISIHISDVNSEKTKFNQDFKMNIYSLPLNFRQENKAVNDWVLTNLKPGQYKIEVFHANSDGFPDWREKSANCLGCTNGKNTSDFTRTSFDLDLKAGDDAKLIATYYLNKAIPLNQPTTPTRSDDHTAPVTNLFYPTQNGTITYKTDGKICVYESEPTDSSGDSVTTYFAFDGMSFNTGIGYLCSDNLPNGSHSMQYYSKDNWGNTETTKTLDFNVNIAGN